MYMYERFDDNEILRYELCIILVLSFCSVISAKKEFHCEAMHNRNLVALDLWHTITMGGSL